MAIFRNFFSKGTTIGNEAGKIIPLKEAIPNYHDRILQQVSSLQRALDAFKHEHDTSLDIILSKSLNNLKSVLLEYARILEQILVARSVISLSVNPRRRNLKELVSLSKEHLHFRGGDKALATAKFLADMQNTYLSHVEEKIYIKHIQSVKQEYGVLERFIEIH